MVTLRAAIKNTGAVDVTLEENEEGDDDDDGDDHDSETAEVKESSRQGVNVKYKKCDQGTQTQLLALFAIADIAVHESIKETHL